MLLSPSPWVQRFAALIAPQGRVLDVACGSGRHVRWLAAQGYVVTGVDRDEAAVAPLRACAEIVVADIEGGPWPLPGRRFDGVVITNYLWRPLWPVLLGALAERGVFIHETFAIGQQLVGKPSRPDFLLQPGELLQACAGLRIVAFEDGFEQGRYVQRIAAVNERANGPEPPRYSLAAPAS
jgi:SAM-dependent methyltransferase